MHWYQLLATDDLLDGITRDQRIAVVGNGPSTPGAGEEIDHHDIIIRFNNWVTEGHEQDVGEKVSIWCTSGYKDIKERTNWTGSTALCPFPAHIIPAQFSREFVDRTSTNLAFTREDYHLREFINNCKEFPSTGFCMIALLRWLGFERLKLFNFDCMDSGHYFNNEQTHGHKRSRKAERSYLEMWELINER